MTFYTVNWSCRVLTSAFNIIEFPFSPRNMRCKCSFMLILRFLHFILLADIIFVFSLIHSDKPENYDVWYESHYEECDKEACLSFSKDILCSRVTVDHNYYAICQNLLSRFATWRGTTGGLLHDPPADVVKDGRLTALLDECTQPQKLYGRFQAAKELREFLTQLTQLSNTNR